MKRSCARCAARYLAALAAVWGVAAWAGHELPIYPSYYPHAIALRSIAPKDAPPLLADGTIQAYVGALPPVAAPPAAAAAVETLGSFVVLEVDPSSPLARERDGACAIAAAVISDLAGRSGGDFVFHPYPVTPFHGDYLYHADLAEAAKRRWRDGEGAAAPKLAASGAARRLVRPDRLATGADHDAVLSQVDADALVAAAMTAVNGWLGPPWLRQGWFQADQLLDGAVTDPAARQRVSDDVRRLESEDYDDPAERINLERDLVRRLAGGCRKSVVGYTLARRYFNDDYSLGIENLGYDSISGFRSPMFLRTAKLKDFPWNGWLGIGIDGRPEAAWNPIAGFTDGFGRLLWFALGDPAMLPAPNDSGWTGNRVADIREAPAP